MPQQHHKVERLGGWCALAEQAHPPAGKQAGWARGDEAATCHEDRGDGQVVVGGGLEKQQRLHIGEAHLQQRAARSWAEGVRCSMACWGEQKNEATQPGRTQTDTALVSRLQCTTTALPDAQALTLSRCGLRCLSSMVAASSKQQAGVCVTAHQAERVVLHEDLQGSHGPPQALGHDVGNLIRGHAIHEALIQVPGGSTGSRVSHSGSTVFNERAGKLEQGQCVLGSGS